MLVRIEGGRGDVGRWRGWNSSIYGLGIIDLGERRRAGRVGEAPRSEVNECVDIGGHAWDMAPSSSSMFGLSNLLAFLRGARSLPGVAL